MTHLTKITQIVNQKSFLKEILCFLHENCALFGMAKTFDRVRELFCWPGISKDVHEWLISCEVCCFQKHIQVCWFTRNTYTDWQLGNQVVCLCMCFCCGDFFWQHTLHELNHSWTSFLIQGRKNSSRTRSNALAIPKIRKVQKGKIKFHFKEIFEKILFVVLLNASIRFSLIKILFYS